MLATKNKKIKNMTFISTDESLSSIDQLMGKWIVLYFYPKDNTSGCTKEAQDFSENFEQFQKENIVILGVSKDSLTSHHNFIKKIHIPFPLISDPDEALCQYFNVIKEKSLYGKKHMGIERSTFIIDDKGILRHETRNVKVSEHVKNTWRLIQEMKKF